MRFCESCVRKITTIHAVLLLTTEHRVDRNTQEESPGEPDLVSNRTQQVTAFIVDDPEQKARKEGGDPNQDCPPHISAGLDVVNVSVEQIHAPYENKGSEKSICNLMKSRVFDVHVNDGYGGGCKN